MSDVVEVVLQQMNCVFLTQLMEYTFACLFLYSTKRLVLHCTDSEFKRLLKIVHEIIYQYIYHVRILH